MYTRQRQVDLLRLPWSAYDGTHIRVKRSKTGTRVKIPVADILNAALDAAMKVGRGPIVLVTSNGMPWTGSGFRSLWQRSCKAQRGRDRFLHRAQPVGSILDAHHLARDPQLIENAIRKLETRTKLQTEKKEVTSGSCAT